jgi:hypothetical protein
LGTDSVSEGKPYGASKRRGSGRGRRALIASGVAASVAAAGLAAAPAGAAASSKLYACYSDKTKALYYAKSAKCKSGFTPISWNNQGPQGAQGAQGTTGTQGVQGTQGPQGTQGGQGNPGSQGTQGSQGNQGAQGNQGKQGPAGAIAGYTKYTSFARSSKVTALAKNVSTVVATVNPTASADYAVFATADVIANVNSHGGGVFCHDRNSPYSAETARGVDGTSGREGDIATNGILAAGPTKTIVEVCEADSTTGDVYGTQLTAVQLSSASVSAGAMARPKAQNRFVLPRKARHQARTK